MVKKVTLTNSVTKDSIVISSNDGYYIIDEIDWDTPSVEMSAYRVPYQIGQSYAGLTVGTRKPTITGYVVAKDVEQASTWEQYWQNCETAVQDKKEELDRIVSIYGDNYINPDAFPDSYEAGTLNMPAIWSLKASLDFINENIDSIRRKEYSLVNYCITELEKNDERHKIEQSYLNT